MQKAIIILTALLGVACIAMYFVMQFREREEKQPPTPFVVLQLDTSRLGTLTPYREGFVVGNARGELRVFADLQPGTTPQIYPVSTNPIVAPVFERDGVFYVGDTNGTFWAFDPETGVKWSYKTYNQITGSAMWCDGMVVVGSHDHTLYAFDPETGELQYTVECNGEINGSPLYLESQHAILFGSCDGLLRKIDVRTGSITADINFDYYIPETPTLYDGILYLLTRNYDEPPDEDENNDGGGENQGLLAAIDADSFGILWRVPTKDMYSSAPYATNDYLFLTTYFKGKINVHSRKDGKYLTTLDTEEKMTTLQAGDDSRVFAVSKPGKLYEWRRENGTWHGTLLADLQTDCTRGCLLLGDKLIVVDDNGGMFYLRPEEAREITP
ncbi:MAG: PQQ-binding-like beta-propeller repeat protein [Planctomycetaceae bacterium]|nr:PQQ-binding-like beta-propeller repeat protein [Planctomycetaceae bacterium]